LGPRNATAAFVRALCLWTAAAGLFGQSPSAQVSGTVRDQDQRLLPGANVTVSRTDGGLQRSITTGEAGSYALVSLPAGAYVLKAEMPNFRTSTHDLVLNVADRAEVDIVLEVGDIRQEVTVIESLTSLKTASAEVGEVVDNQRVVNLPLNGRRFADLTLLSDNVVAEPKGTRGAALGQTGPTVAIAGQRGGHNMYYLDGVSITDQYFNNLSISLSVDALQEFNIQKSIYPAEYGGKASASISAITKSGGNGLHGSVYEFVRNSALDARNFFNGARKPPLRQNQFGGTVGGALARDRTFLFLSGEGLRERRSLTGTFSLPPLAARDGDFSGLGAIYDPLSTNAQGQRVAFAGNRIPLTRLDPAARLFLNKVPVPQRAGHVQNFEAEPVSSNDNSQFTTRLDHTLSPKGTFYGRYSHSNSNTFRPFGSSDLNEVLVPGFGTSISTYTRNLAVSHTRVYSPGFVQDVRFGYLNVSGGQRLENQGNGFAQAAGLGGVSADGDKLGFPAINLSGAYSSLGDPARVVSRRNTSFDIFGAWSLVKGAHTAKFGVYLYRLQFRPSDAPNARGVYTFSPRFSSSNAGLADGNAFADFLLGYPSSAQAGAGKGTEDGRASWVHGYGQDDWRLRSDLVINAGLRYEFNGHMSDTGNRLSNVQQERFVIASDDQGRINPEAAPLMALIPTAWVTSKEAGYARSLLRPGYVRLAPRFGLAWSPGGARAAKTVVRAGFGLFFNQWAYSVQTSLMQNLPFYFNKSVNVASDAAVPTLSFRDILLSPATGTIGGSGMDQNYRSEYAESWSLSLQRQVAPGWTAEASYFGSKVVGADDTTFYNIPRPGRGAIAPRRPNPALAQLQIIHWGGYSNYHSLSLKLEKRLSHGSVVNANYAWSKATDVASSPGPTFSETNFPQDVYYRRAEEALSSFDHRHRLVFSLSQALPGGFTLLALGTFQSGAPFTVNLPNDNANIGTGPAQRPDVLRDPNLERRSPEHWFDTAAFTMPQAFTFGNAGRNLVRGDGLVNLDASIQKEFVFSEHRALQFRGEWFNSLNNTNFADAPGRIAFTPNFGRYFAAENPRQVQLAVKFRF
jgi:hypothetical protein